MRGFKKCSINIGLDSKTGYYVVDLDGDRFSYFSYAQAICGACEILLRDELNYDDFNDRIDE